MGSDLIGVLAWMVRQDFEHIRGPLLEAFERLVVSEHKAVHRDLRQETWTPHLAYRWIRYEDPDPVGRLLAAATRLDAEWGAEQDAREDFWRAHRDQLAVAVGLARRLGYA